MIDIKAGSVPEGGESSFRLAEYRSSWFTGRNQGFYPKNESTDSEEEKER